MIEELLDKIRAKAKVYDEEADVFPCEADYFWGVRDGLNKALDMIEDHLKKNDGVL